MDNFKAVYKILIQLEKDMDREYADVDKFGPGALCVSEQRWMRYLEMMGDCGYIKGVVIKRDITGTRNIDCRNIQITLKGLEYLQENSIMRKIYRAAVGISDLIP